MPPTINRRDVVRVALAGAAAVALPTAAVAAASTTDVPSLPDGVLGGVVTFYHHPSGWHQLKITAEPDATTEPELHQAAAALVAAMIAASESTLVVKRTH